MTTDLPKPKIVERPRNETVERLALEAGASPVLARILAGRPVPQNITITQLLNPQLSFLTPPWQLADLEKSASRVVQAIINGEYIGLETDHDCDGQTSHAVLHYNLVKRFNHPANKIRSYIGHRLNEGYGLSEALATRILADDPRPTLLITADNGSSDEPRIALLKAQNIDVIITDHHEIPVSGYPKSAYACLNPTREDCQYPDPYIAGCMVAWLLMTAVRQQLIQRKRLPENTPSLADSLDFVAVGTIADCVSMARSFNNRAVVSYGLKLIEKATRPCWRATKTLLTKAVTSEDLGFRIGPLLNSDGRLATAFNSVSFLLAETDKEAMDWIAVLKTQNEERKLIQRKILKRGMEEAKKQVDDGRYSLCIYLEDGHSGVHGIVASRVKEAFGRPTIFCAPKVGHPELITGSARGIDAFHVRQALQSVADKHPNLFVSFGGHKGAGGVALRKSDFEIFSQAFEEATKQQLSSDVIGPVLLTDGALNACDLTLEFVESLEKLEPFGREFDPPIFQTNAEILDIRSIGDGSHARLLLKIEETSISAVWFSAHLEKRVQPLRIGTQISMVFSLRVNEFRGQRSVDVQIVHLDDRKVHDKRIILSEEIPLLASIE